MSRSVRAGGICIEFYRLISIAFIGSSCSVRLIKERENDVSYNNVAFESLISFHCESYLKTE